MNLQSLINSRLGIAVALGFGKTIPSGPGYWLAEWIGAGISSLRFLSLVKAARANQWVVSGETLSGPQLSAMTRATLRNTGHFLYDFYHHLDRPEVMRNKVKFSPEFLELIALSQESRQGILFVVPHLSNVDLVGQVMGLSGFDFQVLSYPQPPGGYLWQNELRRRVGLNITPMSISALRQAGEHLRQGGMVLTGLDRPLPDSKYRPIFFGRPTALPVSYVRLALKAHVPVVVLACILNSDGKYHLEASSPIQMEPDQDLHKEILKNAEPVLEVAAGYIRQAPTQWSMYYPLWPEVLTKAP